MKMSDASDDELEPGALVVLKVTLTSTSIDISLTFF